MGQTKEPLPFSKSLLQRCFWGWLEIRRGFKRSEVSWIWEILQKKRAIFFMIDGRNLKATQNVPDFTFASYRTCSPSTSHNGSCLRSHERESSSRKRKEMRSSSGRRHKRRSSTMVRSSNRLRLSKVEKLTERLLKKSGQKHFITESN